MNELNFSDDAGRVPQSRGNPRPLTAQMRAIAQNPSHAWMGDHAELMADRREEKAAESRQKLAERRARGHGGDRGFKTARRIW